MWFFFVVVFPGVGGGVSYLKDKGTVMEQPNPSLRRMAAGSLWKDRLALPPFLFASSPLAHRHSDHFLHPSHLVCYAVCLSLNSDANVIVSNPTKWFQQEKEKRCAHTHTC